MNLLVTGGAGFIGSHFIRSILAKYPDDQVTNLDKLTYAGNLANLRDVESDPRYAFIRGDICDPETVDRAAKDVDAIVNFAAETHVDRSIQDPGAFIQTDIGGTRVLLEAARRYSHRRYLQVSTDEVYGSTEGAPFVETDPLKPSSPYAASKAGGDLMTLAYGATYGVPVLITRASNNFGPNQYPEKLIPLFITNAIDDRPLPLYGDGRNVRDWIAVEDHCEGVDVVLRRGRVGEIYNVGGGNERTNLEITEAILKALRKPASLITPVADRPGHDRRYALNAEKLARLGFRPRRGFEEALSATIEWYRTHESWWRPIKSGEFRAYYEKQYKLR
ncbi:MAG: dTDP-glucose 4,6-dehydratase [Nitrospirae bacterium RIFCSPHIGHO2_01_FULL_66_17]|nr:MAG: dTDP-glucose 4,6-dehydratase [Nitrospirae bacterium RIFCSPHIGHO2_01_FULL_66_17]